MPRASGWPVGKAPRPSSVLATGTWRRSAKARSWDSASEMRTPWPARMTGRLAAEIELDGLLDGAGLGAQHGVRAMRGWRGGGEVEGRGGLLRVFRYIDEHRAGTAGGGDLEGGADGGRDVFHARDEEVVLGDGQGDAGDVDLLEGVGAEDLGGDLAGDADDGDGVQHGGGDAGDEVGGPGAAGGDGDADAAGCARVSVGHVGRALLVADQDVVDGKLAQRIVGGKDGPAGIAEDGGYALAGEGCPDDFRSGEGGDVFTRIVCHRGLLMLLR